MLATHATLFLSTKLANRKTAVNVIWDQIIPRWKSLKSRSTGLPTMANVIVSTLTKTNGLLAKTIMKHLAAQHAI